MNMLRGLVRPGGPDRKKGKWETTGEGRRTSGALSVLFRMGAGRSVEKKRVRAGVDGNKEEETFAMRGTVWYTKLYFYAETASAL